MDCAPRQLSLGSVRVPPITEGHGGVWNKATAEFNPTNHFPQLFIRQRIHSVQYFRRRVQRNRADLLGNSACFAVIGGQTKPAHGADGQAEGFAVIQFSGQRDIQCLLFGALRLACTEQSLLEERG